MSRKFSPILVGIKFLDTFINFGQGIMTFAIFGLESEYVFTPLQRWFEKASLIWTDPECQYTKTGTPENASLHFTLVCVQVVAKKKFAPLASQETLENVGQKKSTIIDEPWRTEGFQDIPRSEQIVQIFTVREDRQFDRNDYL